MRRLNQTLAGMDEGEDYIFNAIAAGIPLDRIAESLGVSKAYLYVWRTQAGHEEERKRKWAEAMELSAISKDEEGAKILDELEAAAAVGAVTREQIQLATARAKYRQWQAEKRSEKYRPGQNLDVNVKGSIEHLHLDALRQLGGPVKNEEIPEGEVVDAELIDEPADDVVGMLKEA